MAVVRKLWEFEPGTIEPRPDNMGRFLPPEVKLTDEDRQRIAVARGLNSITRAYIMGLLAGYATALNPIRIPSAQPLSL